ncbi:MAG: response regulator transcription factor [Acidimicrobiales bacterium]
MNILIVEDDDRIASFISKGLRAEGYATVTARDAPDAYHKARSLTDELDLVLLDLSLPSGDGQAVLRQMRESGMVIPVIIVTARDDVREKVSSLDAGANDYITKPFSFDELLARIRAALRSRNQPSSTELVVCDLKLDLVSKVAWRNGKRIDLAPREWALLEFFMRNPSQILSRSQILNHVWDYNFDPGSNIVDVYVAYLRRKLNQPELVQMIQTVRGAGYRLLPPDAVRS